MTTAPERAIEQRDEMGEPSDLYPGGQVGRPVLRYGGGERASGAQRFVADLRFPGALQVALVTVPVGCADVLGIDTTAARAIPGVVDVVTAADLPSPMPRFGVSHTDRPVLADGRVNYHGEPVAAVVAETLDAAQAAARAVVVDYRELPGVYSLDAALAPGAHLVQDPSIRPGHAARGHERPRGRALRAGATSRRRRRAPPSSSRTPTRSRWSRTSRSSRAAPSPSRPRPAASTSTPPCSTPTCCSARIASVLGLPLNQVRVFAPDPGGGFGGKQNPKLEPLLAFLALRTRRDLPARAVAGGDLPEHAARRLPDPRPHRLHRRRRRSPSTGVEADFQIGAYADVAPRVMGKGSYVAAGPYRIPGVRIDARAVMTNTTRAPRSAASAPRRSRGRRSRSSTPAPGCSASTAWRSGGGTWSPRARRSSAASRRPPPTANGGRAWTRPPS